MPTDPLLPPAASNVPVIPQQPEQHGVVVQTNVNPQGFMGMGKLFGILGNTTSMVILAAGAIFMYRDMRTDMRENQQMNREERSEDRKEHKESTQAIVGVLNKVEGSVSGLRGDIHRHSVEATKVFGKTDAKISLAPMPKIKPDDDE